MIFDAIEFAARAHAGQFRKGTNVPYIVHPLGVAKTLIECGCSQEIVVAAVLHDTVEDTSVSLEDIRRTFGTEVARLVREVSEPDKKDSWENRKNATIEHLRNAPDEILLLSCADKLDNIRAIAEDLARLGDALWERFNRPKELQRWYYRNLARVFMDRIEGEPGASLFRTFASNVHNVFGDE